MNRILILGAGRSSSSLIKYLLENSSANDWQLTVSDAFLDNAEQKIKGHPRARAISFDIHEEQQRKIEIKKSDVVISLLPAFLHPVVAKECVHLKKHLVTASYISKEMAELNEEAQKNGLLLLNEMGLDPGIDHLSAMKIIDSIKLKGGTVTSFKSYTGGLVAPECNDNPWGYKFTWNPRNVVLAGQGTAQYIENGKYKYVPYSRLFRHTESIKVKGLGYFEGYPNRDSLSYRKIYGLEDISTMLRGTLRMPGFCKAWDVFVQLGLTDDTYKIADADQLTYRQLLEAYLPCKASNHKPQTRNNKLYVKQKTAEFIGEKTNSEIIRKLEWLGIFEDTKIKTPDVSPAQILQNLLEKKWVLKKNDVDMIVMQHRFEYKNTEKGKRKKEEQTKKITSSLVVNGEDAVYTAMAKTVGLPLGIATGLLLKKQLKITGVQLPVMKEIYIPVLAELEKQGIHFFEENK